MQPRLLILVVFTLHHNFVVKGTPNKIPHKTRIPRDSPAKTRVRRIAGVPGPVWHAGIYFKKKTPWEQICGGSIVSRDLVISAAHCFWEDDTGKQPAEDYAVAASKAFKRWDYPNDKNAQKSDVREIVMPVRYRGAKTSFQSDIAALRLATPLRYTRDLRPVCVDFGEDLEERQLRDGNSGTIAGWGYTDEYGSGTERLLWLELPYVAVERCIAGAEPSFLKYITNDKICAGEFDTGKALCKGDSGGGLIFWEGPPNSATPYLRGVASTAPGADNLECNVFAVASFTAVADHRRLLLKMAPGLDRRCEYREAVTVEKPVNQCCQVQFEKSSR